MASDEHFESMPRQQVDDVIGYVEDSTSLFPEDNRNISATQQQNKQAMDEQAMSPAPPSDTRHNFKSKRRHKHDKHTAQSRDATLSTPQRAVSPPLPPETISNDMSDIKHAKKGNPYVPHRVERKQLKVLVTGQPETGRTTTIKNLFAALAEDPDWCPTDVSGLTMKNFRDNPNAFVSTIEDHPDSTGHMSISYIIQETPGLRGDSAECANALCGYLRLEQQRFAKQERNTSTPRDDLVDGRVDVILYFLPINARIREMDLDMTVINAIAAYAPVIPVMTRADCLEDDEVQERKDELESLTAAGLQVFGFPEDVMAAVNAEIQRANPPPRIVTGAPPPSSGPFRLPFNVVAGSHQDDSVHPFWFVRLYRWAKCEAFRTHCSELRLLRQLLFEDGFWTIKEEADARYRRLQGVQPPERSGAGGVNPPTTPSRAGVPATNVFDPDRGVHGSPAADPDMGDDDSDPVLAAKNANNLLRPVSDPRTPTQDVHNVGRRSAKTRLREPVQAQSPISDEEFARKTAASLPPRILSKQLKVLVTGQPETGRTTTVRNLFASISQRPNWAPVDTENLTMDDFRSNPAAFTTVIEDRPDVSGRLSMSYIIQETPGLKGNPHDCANALCNYLHQEQQQYAEQELGIHIPRDNLLDGRVDCVLYFLPINARISEDDLDTIVMNAMSEYAPVIPVMARADCLEEEEVQQRKNMLTGMAQSFLSVFTFPEDVIVSIMETMQGLSLSHNINDASPEVTSALITKSANAFKLPFNIVAGSTIDKDVHQYWFVRKYRWATCEAYRMANSDLRLLRQLLLEEGYWVVKSEADKRYRALQASATGQQPGGAAATRSMAYAAHHGAPQSPLHRSSDAGFGPGRQGMPNSVRASTNGAGAFPAASSMHVQPDTATGSDRAFDPNAPDVSIVRLEGVESHTDRFQVEKFNKALSRGVGASRVWRYLSRKGKGKNGVASSVNGHNMDVDDMLTYSPEVIPTSLMKQQNAEATSRAVKMFQRVLKYMGETNEEVSHEAAMEIAQKLLHQALKAPALRDELYMQLIKQSRGNPNVSTKLRCWELLYVLCATVPPGKALHAMVSSYLTGTAADDTENAKVRDKAASSMQFLMRSSANGARKTLPSADEIDAALCGQLMKHAVFFLDGNFQELRYDLTTTVAEAIEQLSQKINLQNYSTFALFESNMGSDRSGALTGEVVADESVLKDKEYIPDVLASALSMRAGSGAYSTKLLFKKKLFRESDEAITEPQFVKLSYVQAQFDYLGRDFPVSKDDASQICALQILADMGSGLKNNDEALQACIEKYITRSLLPARPREEWMADVKSRYSAMVGVTSEDAQLQFLNIMRCLPYGNSVFFSAKLLEDPTGLLPPNLALGINKRGIHFFRQQPKGYLYSAGLEDIMQFGSSAQAVYFNTRVQEVLHMLQFETRQGADVCNVLQAYIDEKSAQVAA